MKVIFVKDWGINKKDEERDVTRSMAKMLLDMEVIEMTGEIKKGFKNYDLLKRAGLNPLQACYSRGAVVEALKSIKKLQ